VRPEEGTFVAERFRLVRALGHGGMGEVWLAHDTRLATDCAIKFLLGGALDQPGVRARFEREARAAAQLRSPNVVQILDHGETSSVPYIAMELLAGEDLSSRLKRVGKLDPATTVEIVRQIARALTRAHAAGLVHRDLKPANVFLVPDEDRQIVKVLDFGVVKSIAADAPVSLREPRPPEVKASATQTGALMGTPSYMSPEQAVGTRDVDTRSDLWSLGVLTFQCLTGKLPFVSHDLADLVMKILLDPIPRPSELVPELPPQVDTWFQRATEREPDRRFQSARELAEALAMACEAVAPPRDVQGVAPPVATDHAAISPPSGSPTLSTTAGANVEHVVPTDAPPALSPPALASARRALVAAGAIAALAVAAIAINALRGDEARPHTTASVVSVTDEPPLARSAPLETAARPSSAPTLSPRPPGRVVQLAAGIGHTCARFESGIVKCWGDASSGQMGDRDPVPVTSARAIPGVDDAIDVAVRVASTCVVHKAGHMSCFGRLARAATDPSMKRLLERRDLANVSIGDDELCAVLRDGRVDCLGEIETLHDPDHAVAGLHDVRQVVIGDDHVCALRTDGNVLCWGANDMQQLTGPTSGGGSSSPRLVLGANQIVQLSAGSAHTCARRQDGSLVCWGEVDGGVLGFRSPYAVKDGFSTTTHMPESTSATAVPDLNDAVDIATGWNSSCAIRRAGDVVCWGRDFAAESAAEQPWKRRSIPALQAATHLELGRHYGCALLASGAVQCWGDNQTGQLGFASSSTCRARRCASPASVEGL